MRYTKISMTDVIIAGAGAAGLMTAITAARRGLSVTVLEPNGKTGKKLRITGKGRCNVTNDSAPQEFLQKVCTNARFLKSSLYAFPPEAVKDFFEEAGVPLKTERGERVFPVSDNANDIADTLERMAKSAGVRFVRERLVDIRTESGHVSAAVTDRDEYPCRAVVLCTGGLSYPATGSTGDGYRIASKLGHTIVPTRASLVPLEAEADCARMQGLSLRNVGLTLFCGDKVLYREQGEMLFTHFGVSGPLVLSASAHLPEKVSSCRLEIDLKPGLTAAHMFRTSRFFPSRIVTSISARSSVERRTRTSAARYRTPSYTIGRRSAPAASAASGPLTHTRYVLLTPCDGCARRFAISPSSVKSSSPSDMQSSRPTGKRRTPASCTSSATVGRPCVSRSVVTYPRGLWRRTYVCSSGSERRLPFNKTTSPSSAPDPRDAVTPLTVTLPCRIYSSASRREQTPAAAMYF